VLRIYSAGLAVVVMAVWSFAGPPVDEERGPIQGRGTQFFASPTRHVGVYGFSADGRLLLLSTAAKRFPLMDTATGKEIANVVEDHHQRLAQPNRPQAAPVAVIDQKTFLEQPPFQVTVVRVGRVPYRISESGRSGLQEWVLPLRCLCPVK
jgi:hypothetical protein